MNFKLISYGTKNDCLNRDERELFNETVFNFEKIDLGLRDYLEHGGDV
jgi:hypothetical protein